MDNSSHLLHGLVTGQRSLFRERLPSLMHPVVWEHVVNQMGDFFENVLRKKFKNVSEEDVVE